MGSLLPTMSGLHRAMICPGGSALPRVERASTYRSERGTAIHAYLAAVGKLGREEALTQVPVDHRATCEAIRLDELPACDPGSWAAEVALAYNVDTGEARELGRNIGRAYPRDLPGRWVFGTVDVVGLAADGQTVVVCDYKGSLWTPAEKAERNWQLKAGAVAAARVYGRTRATVAIVKIDDFGDAHWDRAAFSDFDLAMAAADFQELADRIDVADAHVREGKPVPWIATGEHCNGCPALTGCPAHLALARQLAVAPEEVKLEVTALLTPENASAAYRRMREIERVLETVQEGIKAYARQTPIEIEPGVVYGPKPRTTETIVADVARPALAEVFGDDFARDAVEQEATKGALDKAIRRYRERTGDRTSLKDLTAKALEAIRRRGGVKKATTYIMTAHETRGKAA